MTGLDSGDRVLLELKRPSPRMPCVSLSTPGRLMASLLVHGAIGAFLVALASPRSTSSNVETAGVHTETRSSTMVFVAPPRVEQGGGGGGGGSRDKGPIPRAQAMGVDALTLPAALPRQAGATESVSPPPLQQVTLEARALASGTSFLTGLPDAGAPVYSDARGSGSGTGFGDGDGSGVGSGIGPGAGPGTGGNAGGGPYRAGGAVSQPTLLTQVRPAYTAEALQAGIQGPVVLELIVRENGVPDAIRVVASLDPGGLDAEAVQSVRQWRFKPGRIDGTPVAVLVTVIVTFHLH